MDDDEWERMWRDDPNRDKRPVWVMLHILAVLVLTCAGAALVVLVFDLVLRLLHL